MEGSVAHPSVTTNAPQFTSTAAFLRWKKILSSSVLDFRAHSDSVLRVITQSECNERPCTVAVSHEPCVFTAFGVHNSRDWAFIRFLANSLLAKEAIESGSFFAEIAGSAGKGT